MITPAEFDLSIVRGTTDGWTIRLQTSDGATPPVMTPVPFDDVHFTVSKNKTDGFFDWIKRDASTQQIFQWNGSGYVAASGTDPIGGDYEILDKP